MLKKKTLKLCIYKMSNQAQYRCHCCCDCINIHLVNKIQVCGAFLPVPPLVHALPAVATMFFILLSTAASLFVDCSSENLSCSPSLQAVQPSICWTHLADSVNLVKARLLPDMGC